MVITVDKKSLFMDGFILEIASYVKGLPKFCRFFSKEHLIPT